MLNADKNKNAYGLMEAVVLLCSQKSMMWQAHEWSFHYMSKILLICIMNGSFCIATIMQMSIAFCRRSLQDRSVCVCIIAAGVCLESACSTAYGGKTLLRASARHAPTGCPDSPLGCPCGHGERCAREGTRDVKLAWGSPERNNKGELYHNISM